MVPSGPWFQYHFDRWTDGAGISSISSSPAGPQAYWYGRTLALQFHPEVTAPTIGRWCEEGRTQLAAVGADVGEIMSETALQIEGSRRRCHALVDLFLERSAIRCYPGVP
jgi:hypothetical protein